MVLLLGRNRNVVCIQCVVVVVVVVAGGNQSVGEVERYSPVVEAGRTLVAAVEQSNQDVADGGHILSPGMNLLMDGWMVGSSVRAMSSRPGHRATSE